MALTVPVDRQKQAQHAVPHRCHLLRSVCLPLLSRPSHHRLVERAPTRHNDNPDLGHSVGSLIRFPLKSILTFHSYLHIVAIAWVGSTYHQWIREHTRWIERLSLLGSRRNKYPPQSRRCVCGPGRVSYDTTCRTVFDPDSVTIYAWPSRGGVIVYDNADTIDFEFLGLNPVAPPPSRLGDQHAEDRFCQRLLMLGAVWHDSIDRFHFLLKLRDEEESGSSWVPSRTAIVNGRARKPTRREMASVYVGWYVLDS